jgi:RNA polymerase sigma-70 factor (ECF subfamily)
MSGGKFRAGKSSSVKDATLATLSAEMRSSLHRWFFRKVNDHAEAEDLVQEVFLRIAKNLQFDGELPTARSYIFKTAANVHVDWLRKREVRCTKDHEWLVREHLADADSAPDRILIGGERLAEATAALLELPERTRVIFVLRRIEGLKYKDIAVRLNISVSAIEKHMVKAMTYLMNRVSDV